MAINPDHPSDKLNSALAQVIREESENLTMLGKWVCLAEVIGENGEPSLWAMTSPGLSLWDQIGLVEFHSRTLQPEVPHNDV